MRGIYWRLVGRVIRMELSTNRTVETMQQLTLQRKERRMILSHSIFSSFLFLFYFFFRGKESTRIEERYRAFFFSPHTFCLDSIEILRQNSAGRLGMFSFRYWSFLSPKGTKDQKPQLLPPSVLSTLYLLTTLLPIYSYPTSSTSSSSQAENWKKWCLLKPYGDS